MSKVLRVVMAVIAALVVMGMAPLPMSSTIQVDTEVVDINLPEGG